MASTNQSAQLVKNFTGLKTLEEVTAQLDLIFARFGDIIDAKPQTISLLNGKEALPSMRAGDFVIDYRNGTVVPGMSDGRTIQPFMLDTMSGGITVDQHGMLESQLLDEDGNVLGPLHVVATTTDSGFMSAADKVKLNLLVGGGTPPSVDASAGTAGVSTSFSRADHVHQVAVGTPVTIGSANSAGSSNNLARADHVHSHGAQSNGAHHAVATAGNAGFMSATDKIELDRLNAINIGVRTVGAQYYADFTVGGVVRSVEIF